MKVVDTQWLLRAHKKALRHNYNRVLAEEAVGLLDPEGFHVLSCVLPSHVNSHGVVTVRCLALLKLKGRAGPVEIVLDLPPEDYNEVPEHQPTQPNTREG